MSQKRMERYVEACGGDTRKAMTLYRYNLQISQEMFTIISCFEVALRNAIDKCLTGSFGQEWLKDSVMSQGFLTDRNTVKTYNIIKQTYEKLVREGVYSHSKLLSGILHISSMSITRYKRSFPGWALTAVQCSMAWIMYCSSAGK